MTYFYVQLFKHEIPIINIKEWTEQRPPVLGIQAPLVIGHSCFQQSPPPTANPARSAQRQVVQVIEHHQ